MLTERRDRFIELFGDEDFMVFSGGGQHAIGTRRDGRNRGIGGRGARCPVERALRADRWGRVSRVDDSESAVEEWGSAQRVQHTARAGPALQTTVEGLRTCLLTLSSSGLMTGGVVMSGRSDLVPSAVGDGSELLPWSCEPWDEPMVEDQARQDRP